MLTKAKFLLAKIQAVAGTPETLTGSEAILTSGLTITPYGGETVSRNYDRQTLGASPVINVNPQVQLQFGVELAGSGTAGTAPGWSAVARACGLEETVGAGTSSFTLRGRQITSSSPLNICARWQAETSRSTRRPT